MDCPPAADCDVSPVAGRVGQKVGFGDEGPDPPSGCLQGRQVSVAARAGLWAPVLRAPCQEGRAAVQGGPAVAGAAWAVAWAQLV